LGDRDLSESILARIRKIQECAVSGEKGIRRRKCRSALEAGLRRGKTLTSEIKAAHQFKNPLVIAAPTHALGT
jgi:hypothetical protein